MLRKVIFTLILILALGFLIPDSPTIPVDRATKNDWHPKTFWFEPWGSSGVHKGMDIFARKGTKVLAATNLLVLYQGTVAKGGKVIVAIGPGWRIHYFAHLNEFATNAKRVYLAGEEMGTVGDSGNARGKPAHLHYSIMSLIPQPWRVDVSTQGYKKIFYLDPGEYLAKVIK